MYSVYILKNASGRKYIGHTDSFEYRLQRHNQNKVFSTKNRGPWTLVRSFSFPTRSEAMKYERWLKRQKGGNSIKRLLKGNERRAPR